MFIMLVTIAIFSGIVSGMGIGGGSVFILITTILNIFEHREAQAYNLIIFIVIGISSTIYNFKNKKIDKNILKKISFPIFIGSLIGIFLINIIKEETLKNIFYIFILGIGVYEIVFSIKNIILNKNKKVSKQK